MRSGALLVLLALFAGACGSAHSTQVSAGGVATSTTSGPSPWCVPVSRERAIARATEGNTTPGEVAVAKLVNGPETHTFSPGAVVGGDEYDATSLYWAVEVTNPQGKVAVVAPGFRSPVAWAVYLIDARTGDVQGVAGGPKSSAQRWDRLPDHSGACTP